MIINTEFWCVLACLVIVSSETVKFSNWTVAHPVNEAYFGDHKHDPAEESTSDKHSLGGCSDCDPIEIDDPSLPGGYDRIKFIFDGDLIDSCDLIKKYKPDAKSGNYIAVTERDCQKIKRIRCDFADEPPTTQTTKRQGTTPAPTQSLTTVPSSTLPSVTNTTNYDCLDVLRNNPNTKSGLYNIQKPEQYNMSVYCDMEEDGGGWTVFQRRNRSLNNVNFSRKWAEYEKGFGDLEGEFWLGNKNIYHLANNKSHSHLSITLEQDYPAGTNWKIIYTYCSFYLSDNINYTLSRELNSTTSPIGFSDYLHFHVGANFSTHDRGPDTYCSNYWGDHGGWWYNNCFKVQLNAAHKLPPVKFNFSADAGIRWQPGPGHPTSIFDYTLAATVMKMRRSN